MSFIYSRALVEASSLGRCSDTDASVPSSGSPMPQAYSSPDKMMALSRLSRFGMTFAPLTADRGEELLTSWLAGFRAKTSALPEKAQASPESDPGCGPTWRGSLAKFDPVSSSWKTVQLCLLGDSELSSVTWPRSGMTAGGQCWELPMSERRTGESASGLWPTPLAQDAKHSGYAKSGPGMADKLSYAVVRWPTPQASDNRNRRNADTPAIARRIEAGKQVTLTMTVSGGQLNPTWVEWLMGWPLGWTDLKPLETDKFHSAPRLLSSSLPPVLSEAA